MNIIPINNIQFKAIYVNNESLMSDAQKRTVSNIIAKMQMKPKRSIHTYNELIELKGYDLVLKPGNDNKIYANVFAGTEDVNYAGYLRIYSDAYAGEYDENNFDPENVLSVVKNAHKECAQRSLKILSYLIGISILIFGAIISSVRFNKSHANTIINNGKELVSDSTKTISNDTLNIISNMRELK